MEDKLKEIEKLQKRIEELENREGLFFKKTKENHLLKLENGLYLYDEKIYKYVCDVKTNKKNIINGEIILESDMIIAEQKLFKFVENATKTYKPFLKNIPELDYVSDAEKPLNLLIEGDNYFSLQCLQENYKNKIDVIYIDPPYNTSSKFVYEDSFKSGEWLNFMSKRLELARELLTDDGVIFISIDDNESHRLRMLCDEIFVENNFLSSFIWQKKSGGGQAKYFYEGHEYILIYCKNKSKLNDLIDLKEISKTKVEFDKKNNIYYYLETDKIRKMHGKYNQEERRCYFEELSLYKNEKSIIDINEKIKKGDYVLVEDKQHKGKHFIAEKHELIKKDNAYFKKIKPYSIISNLMGAKGGSDFYDIFNSNNFDYAKPVDLILFLIRMTNKKDALILDFFAGSGTTGHAVLKLNQEDGGSRSFILCTNNENNICKTITYERMKRINDPKSYNLKIEDLPHNLMYYEIEGV